MKKFLAFLSLALIAIPSSFVALGNKATNEVKADELATVHVMSCNLAQDGGSSSSKISKAISIMTEADPDLIGTQEETPAWTTALVQGLSSTYGHVVKMRGGSVAPNEGSGIFYKLSRFTLLKSGTFWFGPEANEETQGYVASSWGASFARVCEYVYLYDKLTGEDICYFNAHYEYGHDNNKQCRINCGDQVVRRMKSCGLPGFFTGDLNFYREDEPESYAALDAYLDESHDYMESRGGDTGYTFHGYGRETLAHESPIDYNWYTASNFVPETFTIYKEEVSSTKPVEDYYSDHFYISTVYRYTKAYDGPDAHYYGTKTIEAETAEIFGTSSDPDCRMTGAKTSSNTRPTSNGACVLNFSVANNAILFKFNLDRDLEDIPLSVWFAPSAGAVPVSGNLSVTCNGEAVSSITQNLPAYPGDDKWYDWTEIKFNTVDLREGSNIIVLTNVSGCYGNFDCIDLEINGTAKFSPYEPVVNSITIECESVRPYKGTSKDGDSWVSYSELCSRGACIGNWGWGDTETNYYFNVSDACSNVVISLFASNFGNNGSTNPNEDGQGIWVSVNGTQVQFDESYWELTPTGWYTFQELHVSNVSLNKGKNYFHVEGWNMYDRHNLDKIVITADETVELSNPNDAVENFVNNDLKMTTYTENKGWCKDTEHHYYSTAKTNYNAMNDYDKTIFTTVNAFSGARNRFAAWASANGDVLTGISLVHVQEINEVSFSDSMIIAVVAISLTSTLLVLLIVRKKKLHIKK